MQILSAAGCFAANWKNCILAAALSSPSLWLALLSLARHNTNRFAEWRCAAGYSTPFPPLSLPSFSPETIRAIARKRTVITAPRNWLIMRGWIAWLRARGSKRERWRRRRDLFFGRDCCQRFYPSAFLSPLQPSSKPEAFLYLFIPISCLSRSVIHPFFLVCLVPKGYSVLSFPWRKT